VAETAVNVPEPASADALILVWGPPSHGPRSRVMARELGLPIHFVEATVRRGAVIAPYKYLVQTLSTVRYLQRVRPRTVLVQSPPSIAVLVVHLWARRSGASYVVDAHSDAMDTWYWTRPRWLHRYLARRAAVTLVTNEVHAARLRRWGASAKVVRDVPTSFEVGDAWRGDGRFTVAVVNTFAPDEPLDAILEAARTLPDVLFRITGSLRRAPSDLAVRTPENVTFTDYLPDARYHGLLASSDAVMCLTTRDDTMQRGACEALSLARPIITSRWPLLQDYFRQGAVHVGGGAAEIRDGVLAMRRDLPAHREAVAELRSERRVEWQRIACELRALVDPHPPRTDDATVLAPSADGRHGTRGAPS
jgi:glycosyltransferase involved in cell wall biosynthesis